MDISEKQSVNTAVSSVQSVRDETPPLIVAHIIYMADRLATIRSYSWERYCHGQVNM